MTQEVETLLGVIFAARRKSRAWDREALEMATRAALHQAGAKLLEQLLEAPPSVELERPCGCGQRAGYRGRRSKKILTVLGEVEIERPYYLCAYGHQGQFPFDSELDVKATQYSPGVRRLMAVVGSESSFAGGREQRRLLAGLQVTTKAVEREAEAIGADLAARQKREIREAVQWPLPEVAGADIPILYIQMDGTGVPVVAAETIGRPGKSGAERARTREVKLGCVFTQSRLDDKGCPLRDEASTTYNGAIEGAEDFGRRIWSQAGQHGWSRAKKKVVIGDGAAWIWNLSHQYFAAVIEIVDLYPARQHLWQLAAKLFAHDERGRRRWAKKLQRKLDQGKIEQLVAALRAFPAEQEELAQLLATEAHYFERNAERMRYPAFRKQGLFIGSGVIEAGCKTIIGQRLKQSGMFWTVRGANAILALRCARLSGPLRRLLGKPRSSCLTCINMSRTHAGSARLGLFGRLCECRLWGWSLTASEAGLRDRLATGPEADAASRGAWSVDRRWGLGWDVWAAIGIGGGIGAGRGASLAGLALVAAQVG